ncbi:MAG: GNAT family N-acetyltransferase [Verrucomicrobiota bacterium]
MNDTIIETPRLRLRRWTLSDYAPFYSLNSDPVVMEFMLKTLSKKESNGFIRRIEESFDLLGFGFWALELKQENLFIGFTGLFSPTFQSHFTPCIEIGWRLGKEFWGNGFATEAASAALDFGFNTAKFDEIVSFTTQTNHRSRAVMRRLNMTHDPKDDFDHPSLPERHALRRHVLYRLKKEQYAPE